MKDGEFWVLDEVSDRDLQRSLSLLLAHGARTEARIVAHVAEVAERRLDLRAGYSSLFKYCVEGLGLSNAEAWLRTTAAGIARKYPVVYRLLDRRDIHLSGLCMLRDYLTPENHEQLLAEASGKSKLQILELLARRFPRPDVKSRIRRLPQAKTATATAAGSLPPAEFLLVASNGEVTVVSSPPTSEGSVPFANASPSHELDAGGREPGTRVGEVNADANPNATNEPKRFQLIAPTSEARYRLQLNMSGELRDKLEQARALLGHAVPDGDLAEVIERALDELLRKLKQRRFGVTDRPRTKSEAKMPEPNDTRTEESARREHIPHTVRREVVKRGPIQCAFVGEDGHRCTETACLELDHVVPYARTPDSRAANLRILCRAHNRLEAENAFGRETVERAIRRKQDANKETPREGAAMR